MFSFRGTAGLFSAPETTAGLFTEDEEELERQTMPPEEVAVTHMDVYGTAPIPEKSEQELIRALAELDAELERMPPEHKVFYLEALARCRDQVAGEGRIAFLRREDFNAKRAAERMVRYWDYRMRIFGQEKCFMPLFLEGAMKDDILSLSAGVFQLLPTKDSLGRAILMFDPSRRDRSKHSTDSMRRVLWYLLHIAIEDADVQKKGYVFFAFTKNATYRHFDSSLLSSTHEIEASYFPIRLRSFHICYPAPFMHAISPVLKYCMGRRMRTRLCIHSGSSRDVADSLMKYGLPPESLPVELGGDLVLDQVKWVCERLLPEKLKQQNSTSNFDVLAAAVQQVQGESQDDVTKFPSKGTDVYKRKQDRISREEETESNSSLAVPPVQQTQAFNAQEVNQLSPQPLSLLRQASCSYGNSEVTQPVGAAGNESVPFGFYDVLLSAMLHVPSSNEGSVLAGQQPVNGAAVVLGSTNSAMGSSSSNMSPSDSLSILQAQTAGSRGGGTSVLFANHTSGLASVLTQNAGISLSTASNAALINSYLTANPILRTPAQDVGGSSCGSSDPSPRKRVSLFLPRVLAIPGDETKVSALQCLVRSYIEVFVATEEHASTHARGRSKPIFVGQVGIRCRLCQGLPLGSSPKGSMYFPSTLIGLYQTAQKMVINHFVKPETCCKAMPQEVQNEFVRLYAHKLRRGGGKEYWAEAGKAIGLVDTPSGIRFAGCG